MKKRSLKKGFTLIEIMVSVTIFLIVMVTAIGSILSITNANRKAQTLNSVMSNLNFAIESMVRDVRTGVSYYCNGSLVNAQGFEVQDCASNGGSSLSFVSSSGQAIVYRLGDDCDKTCIEEDIDDPNNVFNNNNVTGRKITAVPDIKITNLKFYVRGSEQGDGKQPEILIQIQGTAGATLNTTTAFNIQTLVSQRLLDS